MGFGFDGAISTLRGLGFGPRQGPQSILGWLSGATPPGPRNHLALQE